MRIWTESFVAVRMSPLVVMPSVFHVQSVVFGTGGIVVGVILYFFKGAFIPWGIWDKEIESFGIVLKA